MDNVAEVVSPANHKISLLQSNSVTAACKALCRLPPEKKRRFMINYGNTIRVLVISNRSIKNRKQTLNKVHEIRNS